MANRGSIDEIKVGVGVDLGQLDSELRTAKQRIDKNLPKERQISVRVHVKPNTESIQNLHKSIEDALQRKTSGQFQKNIKIRPAIEVDPRSIRDFKLGFEREFRRQAGSASGPGSRAIRVPVQFDGNIQRFRQSVEVGIKNMAPIEVPVKGRWEGGGGPGPGGGGGTTGRGFPGPIPRPGPGPSPATGAPKRAKTEGAQTEAPPRRPSRPTPGRPTEARSDDTRDYGTPPPVPPRPPRGPRGPRQAPPPGYEESPEYKKTIEGYENARERPIASEPVQSDRQRRKAERATRKAEGAAKAAAQAEARVDIGNVRAFRPDEELTGEERAAAVSQQRARPTSPMGQFEQPGERETVTVNGRRVSRVKSGASPSAHRRQEEMAAARRREEAAKRAADPRSIEAANMLQDAGGLEGVNPALEDALRIVDDPTATGSFGMFSELKGNRYEAGASLREQAKTPRQRRRLRNVRQGRANPMTTDPRLLAQVALTEGLQAEQETQLNPLAAVQAGDNKLRGRGGKVGRSGGFTAGRLSSETIEPSTVQEIARIRSIGGTGSSWKALAGRFSRAEIAAAKNLEAGRRSKPEPEPIEPGKAYGGGAELHREGLAPIAPGGQGIIRVDPVPRKPAADAETVARIRGATATEGWVHPRVGSKAIGGYPEPPLPGTFPQISMLPGEGPMSQRQSLYPRIDMLAASAKDPAARRALMGPTSPSSYQGALAQRYMRLRQAAGRPLVPREAAAEARRFLGTRNLPYRLWERAEGGFIDYLGDGGAKGWGRFLDTDLSAPIPGRFLRGLIGVGGPMPRPGSKARAELEDRFKVGVRNRRKYEKKPLYQKGGRSDPEWEKARTLKIAEMLPHGLPCAVCGQPTTVGDKGPLGTTVDHRVATADGGTHDLDNLQILCNRHNGFKSGGKSARPLSPLVSGLAEGGQINRPILKATGLLGRMAQAGHEPSMTIVGERGPELIVSDKHTGQSEVVPTHKVPAWLQRQKEGRGKDLTGRMYERATGGVFPWRMRDSLGRPARASEARAVGGTLGGGDITRVFVVNWPASTGFGSTAAGAPASARAAAPGAGAGAPPTPPPGAPPAGGGAAPAGPPGAPPTAGRARSARVDPFDRVRARELSLAGELRTGSLEGRIQNVRAGITESLQETPVRALSVAFGQIAQTAIGGRGQILARARGAQVAAGRAQRATAAFQQLRQTGAETRFRLADIRAGRETFDTPEDERATVAALQGQLTGNLQARRQARAVAQQRVEFAEERERGVLTRGQQIKSQAVGLGGIVAGTAAFSGTIAAVGATAAIVEQAASPIIDMLTGWPQAINRATGAIRDNIAALHGQTQAAAAGAVAPSGISAAFFDRQGAGITRRAEALAAQKAASQAVDITRAASGVGGNRFDKALFEGTGGFLGGNIATEFFGGQPGFLQDIVGRLRAGTTARTSGSTGWLSEAPNRSPVQPAFQQFLEGFGAGVLGTPSAGKVDTSSPLFADTVKDLNVQLEEAAKQAGLTASAFEVVKDASQAQKDAMIESAAAISDEAKARALELDKLGVAITRRGGGGIGAGDFGLATEQLARGQLIQDPSLLLQANQAQRRAQLENIRQQGQFQRQQDIPTSVFLQNLRQPLGTFGTTFSAAGQRLEENAEGQKTLANIERYSKISADAQVEIRRRASQGERAAEMIVSRIDNPAGGDVQGPPVPGQGPVRPSGPAVQRFRQLTGEAGEIAGQIKDITRDINLRQVNAEVADYNNQIRITERSLTDAKDLWAGIQGAQSKTVGGLQGQNILLERTNQLLSRRQQQLGFKSEDIGFRSSDLQFQAQQLQFQLSQRQINFGKAVAGFAAPGSTPAERAARIEEAKIEADFAQRQLDIQIEIAAAAREQLAIAKEQAGITREIFGNQVQQQDNQFEITKQEAQRNITDLDAQLTQLFRTRAIVIDRAAADKAIEDLEKQLDPIMAEIESLLEEGRSIRSQVLSDVTNLMAETGKGFGELVGHVQNAWTQAFISYRDNFLIPATQFPSQYYGSGGSTSGDRSAGMPGGSRAAGWSQSVSTPTRFIAGDAGSEHVLVLRNPQSGVLAGGTGGGTVVNVGGISIYMTGSGGSSDADLEATADKLAAKVEQRINRKLAMIAGGP